MYLERFRCTLYNNVNTHNSFVYYMRFRYLTLQCCLIEHFVIRMYWLFSSPNRFQHLQFLSNDHHFQETNPFLIKFAYKMDIYRHFFHSFLSLTKVKVVHHNRSPFTEYFVVENISVVIRIILLWFVPSRTILINKFFK